MGQLNKLSNDIQFNSGVCSRKKVKIAIQEKFLPKINPSGNGYTPNKLPFETQGVLGGQTFKSLEKLSDGWIDWHQLWFMSADSLGMDIG